MTEETEKKPAVKMCDWKGCECKATHEVVIIARPKATTPIDKAVTSTPIANLCWEHSNPTFGEVVTPDSWSSLCRSLVKLGYVVPKKEHSTIEVRELGETAKKVQERKEERKAARQRGK